MKENESLMLQTAPALFGGVKVILDETSLLIPDGVSFESTERILDGLNGLQNCIKWWIGDTFLYAERAFGEKYAQLLDATDFEYNTLRNICYTAAQVSPAVRRKELTFWHHTEVAPLQLAEQKKFLQLAVDRRLSVAALRAIIRNKQKDQKPNRADTYELALQSILRIATESKDFSKEAFENKDSKINDIMAIAITALDALKAFKE